MRRSQQLFLLASPFLSLASACQDPLPDPQLVITPRILAIKTEVTTPLPLGIDEADQPARAQALPFEGVTITPFLVHPEGVYAPDEIDPVWIACEMGPGQGLFGCISESFPFELDSLPSCPVQDFNSVDVGDPPPSVSPCLIGRAFAPEFVVPFSQNLFVGGDIELTMIAGPPGGTSTDACAKDFLAGESQLPNDCIYAVQRLPLGPPELMLYLLGEFGIEIPGFDPPALEDVPEPDRNPRITKLETEIIDPQGNASARVEVQPGDTVTVRIGDTLRVHTTSPEEDLQTYLVEVNNGESFEEDSESYFGDWYVTWGRLLSGSSDDPESFNEVEYLQGSQDEDEVPPNDAAHIFYVLTDSRQGVNWWHLNLDILPEE